MQGVAPTAGVILLRGSEDRLGAWYSSPHLRGSHDTGSVVQGSRMKPVGAAEHWGRVRTAMSPHEAYP